jgi:uncharacterized membrane protein
VINWTCVAIGIVFSALAQLLIKLSGQYPFLSFRWLCFASGSVIFYAISFLLYFYILKRFELSRISPLMTVGVVLLVTVFGIISGEPLSWGKTVGVLLAVGAVFLLVN